jgi:hypothetical protein
VSGPSRSGHRGSFTAIGEAISVQQADGNTIVAATEIQTLTGVLTGTRVASGHHDLPPRRQIHRPRHRNLHRHYRRPDRQHPQSAAPALAPGNTGTGQIVGDRGTGGLAGLHLQGTFQPMVTSATTAECTYSIQFHFDS